MRKEPPPTPSGKKAHGYGEIMIRVWATGEEKPWESAEAEILAPPGMPFPFFMVACEHLIRATAQKSGAGYEAAIDLLVDGALKSRGRIQGPPK